MTKNNCTSSNSSKEMNKTSDMNSRCSSKAKEFDMMDRVSTDRAKCKHESSTSRQSERDRY